MGQPSTSQHVLEVVSKELQAGVQALLEAYWYAVDVGRDVWDFAVEIGTLRAAGLSNSDLRWLLCKRYVAHRLETSRREHQGRKFRAAGELRFSRRSCFVLTPAGAEMATTGRVRTMDESASPLPPAGGEEIGTQRAAELVPQWDPARHELRLAGRLVKRFKWPAANQERILAAFDEEGWPPRIDDPLPPLPNQDPKGRLHDTIKCLNKNQKCPLVHFRGDGTGEGVVWELALDQPPERPSRNGAVSPRRTPRKGGQPSGNLTEPPAPDRWTE